jgi:hypothetical protein
MAQLPTHDLFAVTKHDDRSKRYWHRIGACWAHQDGDGMTLKISLMPTDLQAVDLVIRMRKPRDEHSQEPPVDNIPF